MKYRDFNIETDPYCVFPDEYIVGHIDGWEPGADYVTGPTVENVKDQIDDYWTDKET